MTVLLNFSRPGKVSEVRVGNLYGINFRIGEMQMIGRILTGLGLLALGYYVGREVGRTESVRKELEEARNKDAQQEEVFVAPGANQANTE